jgi:hypothetical protein
MVHSPFGRWPKLSEVVATPTPLQAWTPFSPKALFLKNAFRGNYAKIARRLRESLLA